MFAVRDRLVGQYLRLERLLRPLPIAVAHGETRYLNGSGACTDDAPGAKMNNDKGNTPVSAYAL